MLVRPRRNRLSPQMRGLVRETSLSPDRFIYPMFVQEGEAQRTPISSMPGQARLSVDLLVETAAQQFPGLLPTAQHISAELSEDNHRALYVPERFAHGYQVLVDVTETSYQVGEFYSPPHERALRYDDPRLGLTWPLPVTVVSDKDKVAPLLETWSDRLKKEMTI